MSRNPQTQPLRRRAWCLAWLCLLPVSPLAACTVPVFRYALDRWPSESWILEAPRTAFTTDPLAASLRNLGATSPLNLAAKPLPAGAPTEARLLFPESGEKAAAWNGTLTPETFRLLTDSPARQTLAQRILSGDSLVWVIVPSSDAAAGEALATRIQKRLTFVQNAAELPAIDPNDPTSRLGPGPELVLRFSKLTVRRDDPEEAVFVRMLAGPGGSELASSDTSFAAVVFGRGRVLGAWRDKDLTEERLDETNLFATRACSCQVKSLHPGWDLLMNMDWDEALRKAQEVRGAPPADPAAAPLPAAAAPVLIPIPAGPAPEPAPAPATDHRRLVIGAGFAAAAAAVLFFKLRMRFLK